MARDTELPTILKQLTREVSRLEGSIRKGNEEQRRTSNAGAGADAGGKAAGAFSTAGTLALVDQGLRAFARSVEELNNPLRTSGQNLRAFAQALPVIGGFVRSIVSVGDALTGLSGKLALVERRFQELAQSTATAAEARAGNNAGLRASFGFNANSAAIRANRFAPGAAPLSFDPRAAERFEAGLAPELAATQARQRGAASAGESAQLRNLLRDQRQQADEASDVATKAREKYEARRRGDFGGVLSNRDEQAGALNESIVGRNQEIGRLTDALQTADALQQSITQGVEAEKQKRDAVRQGLQAQLQLVKQEEQRARGTAQSFGALNKPQQQVAVDIARQAKNQGFESLSPSQRAFLQRAGGGEFVAQGLQKQGSGALGQEFAGLIGQRALPDVIKEKVKLQDAINVSIQVDAEEIAKRVSAELGPLLQSIQVIRNEIKTAKDNRARATKAREALQQ